MFRFLIKSSFRDDIHWNPNNSNLQRKRNLVRVIGGKITVLTDQRETSQFWFESHREVWVIEGSRYRDSTVKHKLLEASPVLFPNNQEIIFFKMRGLPFFSPIADVALWCPPKFDQSISRDEVHHTNASTWTLGGIPAKSWDLCSPSSVWTLLWQHSNCFPHSWVCVPVVGSTKLTLWFTVKCCRPTCLLAWL